LVPFLEELRDSKIEYPETSMKELVSLVQKMLVKDPDDRITLEAFDLELSKI